MAQKDPNGHDSRYSYLAVLPPTHVIENVAPEGSNRLVFSYQDQGETRRTPIYVDGGNHAGVCLATFLPECEINSVLDAMERLMSTEQYLKSRRQGGAHPRDKWPRAHIVGSFYPGVWNGTIDIGNLSPENYQRHAKYLVEYFYFHGGDPALRTMSAYGTCTIPLRLLQEVLDYTGPSSHETSPQTQRSLTYVARIVLHRRLREHTTQTRSYASRVQGKR